MTLSFKKLYSLLTETVKEWQADEPFRHAAIIAYYAIFSMPGLLIIIIWSAGVLFGQEAMHDQVSNKIQQFIGSNNAESIEEIILNARLNESSFWMKALGIGTLVFGATTLFLQLQKSLNDIWGVEAAPKNGILKLLTDRTTSFGVILAIAFLLLISLVLSAFVSILSGWIATYLSEAWLVFIHIFNFAISIGLTTLLFAIMFRVLPDVEIGWHSVWVGSIAASILFTIGKTVLGIYFGYAEPGNSFGAAGSVILIMLWVNYSCLILFFGANLSQVYAKHQGHPIVPSPHAKWKSAPMV